MPTVRYCCQIGDKNIVKFAGRTSLYAETCFGASMETIPRRQMSSAALQEHKIISFSAKLGFYEEYKE
jgi:hypothetical protein